MRRAEEAAKSMLWPSILFEEFGVQYYGPIDGHNLPLLIETFKFLKAANRPVLLHVLTQKGRGFQPALEAEEISRSRTIRSRDRKHQAAQAFRHTRKYLPTRSSIWPTKMSVCCHHRRDAQRHGPRSFPAASSQALLRRRHCRRARGDICRGHGDARLAGRCAQSIRPFCSGHSIRLCTMSALQKLPVVFCMDRAGLSGDDGPTHHGLFDISYLRGVPEMVLMAPKDEDELADMMTTALQINGPSAIRYPRGAVACVDCKTEPQVLPIGKAEVLADGTDVAILGLGPMITMARELAVLLEEPGLLRGGHQSQIHQAHRSRNARTVLPPCRCLRHV